MFSPRQQPSLRSSSKTAGFTLVEVMVSLTIIMVVATATIATVLTSQTVSQRTTAYDRGKGLAQAEVSKAENLPFESLGFYSDQGVPPATLVPVPTNSCAQANPCGSERSVIFPYATPNVSGVVRTPAVMQPTKTVRIGGSSDGGGPLRIYTLTTTITWLPASSGNGTANGQYTTFKRVAVTAAWGTGANAGKYTMMRVIEPGAIAPCGTVIRTICADFTADADGTESWNLGVLGYVPVVQSAAGSAVWKTTGSIKFWVNTYDSYDASTGTWVAATGGTVRLWNNAVYPLIRDPQTARWYAIAPGGQTASYQYLKGKTTNTATVTVTFNSGASATATVGVNTRVAQNFFSGSTGRPDLGAITAVSDGYMTTIVRRGPIDLANFPTSSELSLCVNSATSQMWQETGYYFTYLNADPQVGGYTQPVVTAVVSPSTATIGNRAPTAVQLEVVGPYYPDGTPKPGELVTARYAVRFPTGTTSYKFFDTEFPMVVKMTRNEDGSYITLKDVDRAIKRTTSAAAC